MGFNQSKQTKSDGLCDPLLSDHESNTKTDSNNNNLLKGLLVLPPSDKEKTCTQACNCKNDEWAMNVCIDTLNSTEQQLSDITDRLDNISFYILDNQTSIKSVEDLIKETNRTRQAEVDARVTTPQQPSSSTSFTPWYQPYAPYTDLTYLKPPVSDARYASQKPYC